MEPFKGFKVFLPESQGQNLALIVLYVPYSLDSDPSTHEICPEAGPSGILNPEAGPPESLTSQEF